MFTGFIQTDRKLFPWILRGIQHGDCRNQTLVVWGIRIIDPHRIDPHLCIQSGFGNGLDPKEEGQGAADGDEDRAEDDRREGYAVNSDSWLHGKRATSIPKENDSEYYGQLAGDVNLKTPEYLSVSF